MFSAYICRRKCIVILTCEIQSVWYNLICFVGTLHYFFSFTALTIKEICHNQIQIKRIKFKILIKLYFYPLPLWWNFMYFKLVNICFWRVIQRIINNLLISFVCKNKTLHMKYFTWFKSHNNLIKDVMHVISFIATFNLFFSF